MELREYLSIRRAYNLVRQDTDAASRLTFSEFAILCRLQNAGGSLRTSDIADYQGSLRPTMTHRTKHLSVLGLIERSKGDTDRRNVVCSISEQGSQLAQELCSKTCDMIPVGQALSRVTADRMRRYVDAMGSVACMSGDLILLGMRDAGCECCTVTDLVDWLGLLQPTVSMTVASLVGNGCLERMQLEDSPRSAQVKITEKGAERAEAVAEQIESLVVRRKSRSN